VGESKLNIYLSRRFDLVGVVFISWSLQIVLNPVEVISNLQLCRDLKQLKPAIEQPNRQMKVRFGFL
jgi:hypothetical protein